MARRREALCYNPPHRRGGNASHGPQNARPHGPGNQPGYPRNERSRPMRQRRWSPIAVLFAFFLLLVTFAPALAQIG